MEIAIAFDFAKNDYLLIVDFVNNHFLDFDLR